MRLIQLESEFRRLCQGSLSVREYCMEMKALADGLSNMVLQTISGLIESFSNIRSLIQFRKPFPTFHETRNSIILEETHSANMISPMSALITTISNSVPLTPPSGDTPAQPAPQHSFTPLQPFASRHQNNYERGCGWDSAMVEVIFSSNHGICSLSTRMQIGTLLESLIHNLLYISKLCILSNQHHHGTNRV